MKAITYSQYGSPEVLKLSEVEKPIPQDNQILVKIKATAVNSADLRLRKADPFLVRFVYGILKPKNQILGTVVSGVLENTGKDVTKFNVGDEVFGMSEKNMGTYGEFVCVAENEPLSLKPHNLSFGEAASIPFGGHTALHFLKKAEAKTGQKILIYGASGAVGSSAIQLAKYFGLEVTAVCSEANVDLVKSLGADNVFDYAKNNLEDLGQNFDIVFETVDKSDVFKIANLVKKGGVLVLSAVLIKGLIQGLIVSKTKKIKLVAGVAEVTAKDMEFLKNLAEENKLKPVIDKTYNLENMVKAHEYGDKGHKKGNIVINLEKNKSN